MRFISLYDYLDYRNLLEDYYSARKAQDSKFSYRFFAQRAGYNSSGYYSNLVKGINNLTEKYTEKFIKGLDLSEKEAEYFRLMVRYTHAQTNKHREEILTLMIPFLPRDIRRLRENQREFYSQWYYVAVHQALSVVRIRAEEPDHALLARFLKPELKVPQIKKALKVLNELELMRVDAEGYLLPKDSFIVGGREVGSLAIHDFQNRMMDLAKEAQSRFAPEERQVTTHTIAATPQAMARIKKRLVDVQKDIVDILNSEPGEEQLFQLNIQFFPLSDHTGKEKGNPGDQT